MIRAATPEHARFREEVRDFCARALPDDIRAKVLGHDFLEKQDYLRWQGILQTRGWMTGHWPREHGGLGWSLIERYIFDEECSLAGSPWLTPFGASYIGPVLYSFGSDAQKAEHLPAIRENRVWWCQGFSEPGAGSDLASLRCRAERRGDRYVVQGRKIWTTMAGWADMMFALVRTSDEGRPQNGISLLLIDMKSPGVSIRPIDAIDLSPELFEVLLDDVEVPAENLVGIEGAGWTYTKFMLSSERTLVAEVGKNKRLFRQLCESAHAAGMAGDGDYRDFWRRMAEQRAKLVALESLAWTLLSAAPGATLDLAEAAMLKIRGAEVQQGTAELMLEVAACHGYAFAPAMFEAQAHDAAIGSGSHAASAPAMLREYLTGRATTIYGGSNEIQRGILAKELLAA